MKMVRILMIVMVMFLGVSMSGCITTSGTSTKTMSNETRDAVLKASVRLAAVSYLDRHENRVDDVLKVIEVIKTRLSGDLTTVSTEDLMNELAAYVGDTDMSVKEKVALTSLTDIIITEVVGFSHIDIQVPVDNEYIKVFLMATDEVDKVAMMYKE